MKMRRASPALHIFGVLSAAERWLTNEIAAVCYVENGDEKGGGQVPPLHIFGGLSAAGRGKDMGRSIILLFTEFLVGVLKG